MKDIKNDLRCVILFALNEFKKSCCDTAIENNTTKLNEPLIDKTRISVEVPPNPQMGDLGVPMFPFSKAFKMSPAQIAQGVVEILCKTKNVEDITLSTLGDFVAVGPYVNLKMNKAEQAKKILYLIHTQKENYGAFNAEEKMPLSGQRIMIEFSSPNTNKPLHLGHMRNDALGESVSRILKKAGAQVYKVNIINNRGVHICKSMLAYKLFHEAQGDTPESLGMKGDHFVGLCYVEFDKYQKEHPEALQDAEKMLVQWEEGNEEVRALWKKMNDWTLEGIKETYERTGVSFDKLYFESDTYLKGKDEILKGVEKGIFFNAPDGSVRVDVTEAVGKGKNGEEHEKVLLRKDGTSVYITQDIGTAISRHNDWAFNQMVYVVASEQIYHFKVLFFILKKLGFDWAEKLFHLSYGLVNLPSGRMKSREGTVVDADDLIDSLRDDALNAIKEKGREEEVEEPLLVSEKVALAALHYYLLQVSPVKDMIFNPEESLSFNGNTGPYLQYMGARIASILRKANFTAINQNSTQATLPNVALLSTPEEWELLRALSGFPEIVERAAINFDPSIVATYLYDVSRAFSKFYQQCPILNVQDNELKKARLYLADCTLTVLKNAMDLVLVPYLDKM